MERNADLNGKLVFSMVEAKSVPGLWSAIKPGVEHIHKLSNGTFGWKPEDVMADLMNKRSILFFVYKNDQRLGFFIIRFFKEEFTTNKYLHVWLAYRDAKTYRMGDVSIPVWQKIEQLAKKYEAKYIEFDSPRGSWARKMMKQGVRPHRTVYRKEIN